MLLSSRLLLNPVILFFMLLPLIGCAGHVTIATYNLRNYLIQDRIVDGIWRKAYPKPESEKAVVREIILQADADVLILQELGGEAFLLELREDLKASGLDYPYQALVEGLDENRKIGLLSRHLFTLVPNPGDSTFKYFDERLPVKRGWLEAEFELNDQPWTLFGVHLKSRYTDRPDDPESAIRRRGEARIIRDYIRKKFPPESAPFYLVAGDFNDTLASSPIRHFLTAGRTELTQALPAVDSRNERWTHYYKREDVYSRVDYLMASPKMAEHLVKGSAKILDPLNYYTGSDHRLVIAEFDFSE